MKEVVNISPDINAVQVPSQKAVHVQFIGVPYLPPLPTPVYPSLRNDDAVFPCFHGRAIDHLSEFQPQTHSQLGVQLSYQARISAQTQSQ